jgi:hypothetical protein
LHAAHGDALTGHPGITRTAANIAQFFWWPNMFRDVARFVRSCRTCAAAKSSTGLRLGVDSFSSVPLQPFTHWSMDLIGPLPKSRSGNDLIVTWVDRTSKLIVARTIRQGNSSAKALPELLSRPSVVALAFWRVLRMIMTFAFARCGRICGGSSTPRSRVPRRTIHRRTPQNGLIGKCSRR